MQTDAQIHDANKDVEGIRKLVSNSNNDGAIGKFLPNKTTIGEGELRRKES